MECAGECGRGVGVRVTKRMGRAFKPSPFGVANNLGGGISFCSSDQFYKVFSGAPHLEEDHAKFAVLTRHSSKHGFFADGGQHNGALIAFDVNLIHTHPTRLDRKSVV